MRSVGAKAEELIICIMYGEKCATGTCHSPFRRTEAEVLEAEANLEVLESVGLEAMAAITGVYRK